MHLKTMMLCSLLSLAAAAFPAQEAPVVGVPEVPALTPELLVAHPARATGDNERWTRDLIAALRADPASPYAVDAARVLGEIQVDEDGAYRSDERLDAFAELAVAVEDERASFMLRGLVLQGADRRRLSAEPYPLGGDLFGDFVTGWRLIGPVGRADDSNPAMAPAVEGTPELARGAFEETYPAAVPAGVDAGERRASWRPFARGRNMAVVVPGRAVHHPVGQVFLAAFVRFPDGAVGARRQLEIRGPRSYRVLWNGRLAVDRPGNVRPEVTGQGRVVVTVQGGWNCLLVRVPAGSEDGLSARILMPDGTAASFTEPGAGEPLLLPWTQAPDDDAVDGPEPWRDPLLEPLPEAEFGPFGVVLHMERLVAAGRADEALLVEAPGDPAAEGPWRLAMMAAVESAGHLDAEVQRRRVLGHMEALEAAGLEYAAVRQRRVGQALSEDRPFDALDQVEAWVAAAPARPWPRILRSDVLSAIDSTGTLSRVALEGVLRAFPDQSTCRERLLGHLAGMGSDERRLDLRWEIVEAYGTPGAASAFLDELGPAADPRAAALIDRVEAWKESVPVDRSLDGLLARLRVREGRTAALLAAAEQEARRAPHDPAAWWGLANERFRAGDREGALEAIRRELAIRPADETSRGWAERLGESDPAERFFAAFAPDVDAAVERARAFEDGTSLVEVLDDGMIHVFADGSTHMRSRSVTRICDATGVEAMSALPILEGTRSIRVVSADGAVKEPTTAGGEWVLPALEVGDVVEVVWDRVMMAGGSLTPPGVQRWRFASFEKAFPTTRWVVRLPGDLAVGSIRTLNFEGTHFEAPFEDGVVHIFEESMERQVPEPGMPSYPEVLPLAGFGAGQRLDDDLRGYSGGIAALTDLAADVALEVDAFIAEVAPPGAPDLERARALYEALDDRMLDFEGAQDANSVWQARRGWPLFLYGALLERAGIDRQWAALTRAVSPELEPDPVELFPNERGLAASVLRLEGDGEVVWVLPGTAPGTPFGMLAREVAGAPGYMIEPAPDGSLRPMALPRDFVDEVLDAEIELRIDLVPADGGAPTLEGSFRSVTVAGMIGVGQLREATAQQRQGFARSQAANFAPGADIESAEVVLDGSAGPGLVVRFSGRWPGLLVDAGDGVKGARIPFVPLQLGARFGAAERRWPLALRSSTRLRATVEFDLGGAWSVVSGPSEAAYEREGLTVALGRAEEGETLRFEQTLTQGGAWFEPSEMSAFLKEMTALDGEFERPLRLAPAADESAGEGEDGDGDGGD